MTNRFETDSETPGAAMIRPTALMTAGSQASTSATFSVMVVTPPELATERDGRYGIM